MYNYFFKDFEKLLDLIEELDYKIFLNLVINLILYVIKGKYFRNDLWLLDIEIDGFIFLCVKGYWFWKNVKGEWNLYCREINVKINRCYEWDWKLIVVVIV